MSFKDFKKKSTDLSKLQSALEKQVAGADSYKDDRFWKPTLDQASNGFAVIRFLPPVQGEEIPWARVFSHGFKGKGGWFIENCPTTLGLKCPVCEANSDLWNSGSEDDKTIARDRKRKLSYISNIIVVSDPKNPQNEGKVFLFKYGKKIFDKIMEKIQPEFQGETAVNVYDFWKGADFKLKIRKVAGYVNYDKSEFDVAAPLFGGDDKQLEDLWAKEYALLEFTQPSEFKSYDELAKKFAGVMNQGSGSTKSAEDMDESTFAPKFKSNGAKKLPEKVSEEDSPKEEDAESYFERLSKEED